MNIRVKIYIVLIASFVCTHLSATNEGTIDWPHVIPRTPDVAAMEKFGEYPIGYNTGTVDISVPLYQFTLSTTLNMAITLNYHSSGIRVDDVSGRVGAGWALNAGGSISREIRGQCDETHNSGFYHFIQAHPGYQVPTNILDHIEILDSIYRNALDLEPDLFYLNFLGRSYKFFIGNDGEFHTIPYSNLKFICHPMNNTLGEGRWEIVDENGNHFLFGNDGTHTACEVSTNIYAVDNFYTTAWKLLSIVSPEGNKLATFSYEKKDYSSPNYTKTIYRVRNNQLFNYTSFESYLDDRFGEKVLHNEYSFQGYDLSSIAIPGIGSITIGAVSPLEDNGCHLIETMAFRNSNGNDKQIYHFSYTGQNRKYLSSITRSPSTGTPEVFRSFTYYGGLPDQYHDYSQDLWGYYNAQSNLNLFPSSLGTIGNENFNTANRYPNENAKAGSLESITYPTGGKTCFEYENNYAFTTDSSYNIQYANEQFQADALFGEHNSDTFTAGESGTMTATIRYAISSIGYWKMKVKLLDVNTNDSIVYENVQLFNMSPNTLPLFYDDLGDPVFEYEMSTYLSKGHSYQWIVSYSKENLNATSSLLYPTTISYTYLKNVSTTNTHEAICGGIRIKSITNYDKGNQFVECRKFSYLDNQGHSSGIAAPLPVFKRSYIESVYIVGLLEPDFIGIDEYNEVNLLRYSGSLAQYSDVTETITSTTDSCRTIYYYGKRPYLAPVQLTPVAVGPNYYSFPPNDYRENLLLSKTVYKHENGTDVKIQKNNYQYIIDESNGFGRFFRALGSDVMGDLRPRSFMDSEWFQAATYDIVSAKVLPAKTTITEYSGSDSIVTVSETIYGNDLYINPTQTRNYTAANNSDAETTSYQYCYDFPSNSVATEMTLLNKIAQPLQTEHTYRSCTTSMQTVDSVFSVNGTDIIEPRRHMVTRNGDSQNLTFLSYDRYGNPLHVCLNGNAHRYYLWSYNGRHLIAEIQMGNTTESSILSAVSSVFGNMVTPDSLSAQLSADTLKLLGGYLQTALPNTLVTTFTYDDCDGLASITDPAGSTTRYNYDDFNRLIATFVPWRNNNGNVMSKPSALYSYHYSDNTDSNNYVRTRTMTTSSGDYLEQNTYYDGLGRPVETSLKNASPSANKDIVTLTEYIGLSREQRMWLPIATNNNGNYLSATNYKNLAQGNTLYGSDQRPFLENIYETSALNRISNQFGAGSAWYNSGKSDSTEWLTNSLTGLLECRQFSMNSTGTTLTCSGLYPKGSLHVVKNTDEDRNARYVFTDFMGREVLHRSVLGNDTYCDTYFIYDGFGNLLCVLPPLASSSLLGNNSWNTATNTAVLNFAYLYQYDARGRCAEKKLPGVDKTLYRYDNLNQPIFSQDGNQRQNGEWTFMLNDCFGRPAVQGTCQSPIPDVSTQAIFTEYNSNSSCGYTIPSSITNIKLHSVNYYDNYSFRQLEPTAIAYLLDSLTLSGYDYPYAHTQGLLIGQRVYLMPSSTSAYLTKAFYYDERNRIVQTRNTNHLGGVDVEYLHLSFTGKPLKRYIAIGAGLQYQPRGITEEYIYTYDHADRLLTTTHSLNGATLVVLVSNEYDDIGRLKSNKPRNSNALKTQYTYNVRSWPKTISSPLFSETLYYEDGTTPCWNGNISSMKWDADTVMRRYDYQYDGLSRLTQANYRELVGQNIGRFSSDYSYDLHGNLKTINRHGWTMSLPIAMTPSPLSVQALPQAGTLLQEYYGTVDSLTITYNGNQLQAVSNAATPSMMSTNNHVNFVDGANSSVEYSYDANGNLTQDLNKNLSSIAYNTLNLPDSMVYGDGRKANYLYGADGVKRQVTYTTPVSVIVTPIHSLASGITAGLEGGLFPGGGGSIIPPVNPISDDVKTFDYCGNAIYENKVLTKLLVDGGYVSFTKSGTGTNTTFTPTYHFYMKDHLGSNRVVASAAGTAEQVNHYYPYGSTYYNESTVNQRYKYCGKELDKMHGLDWYDSSARYYDHVLGRFQQIDPLAEKYYSWSPYAYCVGNPVNMMDVDGKSPWSKILKSGIKIGKQVTKNGIQSLIKTTTYTQAFSDDIDNFKTLTDSKSSVGDRTMAGLSLLSEVLPVSVNDIKDIGKIVKKASKKIAPNGGFSRPHGGYIHNNRIDELIERLRRDPDVTNIRKNQKQVDIEGNVIGNNRPDVQFDKKGIHTNVEYDTKLQSSDKHKREIEKNDPSARNKFYKLL